MELSEGVIRQGRNTLLHLHSSCDTQPHSLIVNYKRQLNVHAEPLKADGKEDRIYRNKDLFAELHDIG